LLTVKKAEKSLKKRKIKERSGTTRDFKRATVTFTVGFIYAEGLKSKLQSRDF
jgi:ribosomal protein L23